MASASPEPQSNWSSLPRDLLGAVMDRLVDISDRARAASVCKAWLSTLQDHNMKKFLHSGQSQLPMLLIPTDDNSKTRRGLYSVAEDRILQSQLHVPYNKRCCGSSHGWLVYAEVIVKRDIGLTLFNPFSRETIVLPPLTLPWVRWPYGPEQDIRKVILSKDPSLAPDDYEVLALCGFSHPRRVALFKAGGKSWICTDSEDHRSEGWYEAFHDITFFKGKIFAVSPSSLVSLEPGEDWLERKHILDGTIHEQSYVVGCGDTLMWIERVYVRSPLNYVSGTESEDGEDETSTEDDEVRSDTEDGEVSNDTDEDDAADEDADAQDGRRVWDCDEDVANIPDPFDTEDGLGKESDTGYFEIDGYTYGYRSHIHHLTKSFTVKQLMMDQEGNVEKVVEPDHLNGHALFLGDNNACSVLASDFPGCRPDCIYYMSDWLDMVYQPVKAIDIGVFSMKDHRTRPLCVPGPSQWHLPPPIWILPQANRTTTL